MDDGSSSSECRDVHTHTRQTCPGTLARAPPRCVSQWMLDVQQGTRVTFDLGKTWNESESQRKENIQADTRASPSRALQPCPLLVTWSDDPCLPEAIFLVPETFTACSLL